MKKSTLLASTALVSVALVMGATSANAMKLKISGSYEAWVGYGDNDELVAGQDVVNDVDVKTDSEIHFRASDKLSNGWEVGAWWELEAGNGRDNAGGAFFDEAYLFIKGSWGEVNIGNNDVATASIGGVSTVGPVGVYLSDAGDWVPGAFGLTNTSTDLGIGDAGNVTYFTPRIAGAQLIVSFTPDASDGAASDYDDQETTGRHNAISAALRYNTKLVGARVGLSGGATRLEETDAGRTPGTVSPTTADDTSTGYALRADVRRGPVRVTAAWAMENIRDIDTYWGVGVIVRTSKTESVSVGFSRSLDKQNADANGQVDSQSSDVLAFGYQKNLGKGATLSASVFKAANNNAGTANDFDTWGAVGGFRIRF